MAFDVIGPSPIMDNDNIFILMMIDCYSKSTEAYALPNKKAETMADCIINCWIAHHSIPMRINSDNAPEFRGHVITQLKRLLSMKGTFTMPYRPQSNGLCEGMNQTIENIIEKGNIWDKSLDHVMMAYISTPHSSTGFTSNMLVTGKETNMPFDLIYETPNGKATIRNYNCYCT